MLPPPPKEETDKLPRALRNMLAFKVRTIDFLFFLKKTGCERRRRLDGFAFEFSSVSLSSKIRFQTNRARWRERNRRSRMPREKAEPAALSSRISTSGNSRSAKHCRRQRRRLRRRRSPTPSPPLPQPRAFLLLLRRLPLLALLALLRPSPRRFSRKKRTLLPARRGARRAPSS